MTTDIRQTWATPPDFFKWLDDQFHFDIDVCASKENAKCRMFITEHDDSFRTPWFQDLRNDPYPRLLLSAFCNPGFQSPLQWHQRAFQQCNLDGREYGMPMKHVRFACVLGVQWASQEWARFAFEKTLMIINLSPRIQYIAPPGVKQSSNNYESCVFVYSSLPPCPGNIQLVRWKHLGLEPSDPKPRRARKAKCDCRNHVNQVCDVCQKVKK
jgi:hypothetical protein